ncbi:MAG: hydroxyacid dehydrogenase, partial [Candidatus Neomarinimicrobiota bacterium]
MKVLITDPVDDIGISILKESGLEYKYIPESNQKEKIEAIKDAHGLIIRSGTIVDKKMLNYASNLKVIGRAGVGIDNIDVINATRKGVVVMNTPDVNTISAAEHAMALMLTISRNTHIGHYDLIKGLWSRHNLIGTELQNKIVGIIGLGKIGREVMDRCLSFNMKILGYDPYVNQELFSESNITITDLDNVVQKADYITLHLPLNEKTRNLFDFKRLRMMKPSSKIINVARGGIINEYDLSRALNEDFISGAAIDVFTIEPLAQDNPLLSAKNIVLSPHLGASTKEAKVGVSKAISEQIRDYLIDDRLTNAINMPISNLSLLKEMQPCVE